MEIEIRNIAYGSDEYEESIDLRNELFRRPWGLNIRDEDLTADQDMTMFGAYDKDRLIGTIFLVEEDEDTARIKSVAIDENYQGKGLGRYLMNYVEDIAKERGYRKIDLMARVSSQEFYEKLGYEAMSKPYDYMTIPHLDMVKSPL